MADELVSTAGVLLFDPKTEFQIIEEFDFDELVQRPEEIRFFTLEQQTTSYAQALLPKTGKVPKALLREVEHEVDTMRQLYQRILTTTDEGYEMKESSKLDTLSWVLPYVKQKNIQTAYSFENTWKPLFDNNEGVTYMNILDSLPKLNYFVGSTAPWIKPGSIFTKFENKAFPVLGNVPYTKTGYHEDGSFEIQTIGRPDTRDTAFFDGYRVNVPPIEFPNPLDDNAFLSRRVDPVYLDTDEPLESLLPSMDLIFEHAVPSTANPQRDARRFLKVWDIRMNEIPWSIWKNKFVPEETIGQTPFPAEIPIPPAADDSTPGEEMMNLYQSRWYTALSPRLWLSQQVDGGKFVAIALRSKAGLLKPISIPPLMPNEDESNFPSGSVEDCWATTITDFDAFAQAGVYRPGTHQDSKIGWQGTARCLPLSYILKELEDDHLRNRLPWLPDTDVTMLKDYSGLITARIPFKEKQSFTKASVAKAPPPASDTRTQIMALLRDETRLPEDIAVDILTILKQLAPDPHLINNVYSESTTDEFLICQHTLRQLEGDFAKNPDTYLKTWSAKESGSVVCRFCGEIITKDTFVAQDQFDDTGRAVVSHGSLDKPGGAFVDVHAHTKAFAVSLKELKNIFDIEQPAEDIMYLLISLLQVLPEESQVKPFLDVLKSQGSKLKVVIRGSDKKSAGDAQLVATLLGFASTVLLLQTHNPPLIPRRSVGSKPFQTRGFPRDSSDINDSPLIDSLLNLVKRTFEDYPVSFTGSSVVFVRILIQQSKALRTKVINTVKKLADGPFKTILDQARETIKPDVVNSEPTMNSFNAPMFRFDKGQGMKPSDRLADGEKGWFICKDPIPPWFTATQFFSRFEETVIVDQIIPRNNVQRLTKPETGIVLPTPANTDRIRERSKLTLPKDFASGTYKKLIASNDHIMLQKYTEIVLNTVGLLSEEDYSAYRAEATTIAADPSLLRDFFKGLLTDLGGRLDKSIVIKLERELANNLTLRALNTSADASRNVRDKLRAMETAEYKNKLRVMSDVGREITKHLQDRGLAAYLVTKGDRETFMRELVRTFEETTEEIDENIVAPSDETIGEAPEEGYNVQRNLGEQGNDQYNDQGNELEGDFGDYGDHPARTADGEENTDQAAFNFEEGYGT